MARAGALSAGVMLGVASLAGSVLANPVRSRLTTIELKACTVLQRHTDGNAYRCSGLKGYPIYFAEGDLRSFVSFGPSPATRRAAKQTLRPFNTVFEPRRTRATVEWRFRRVAGADQPYAAIMRLFTSNGSAKGEVLVVTRITAGDACHAAYIDAKANVDAMAMARAAADDLGADVACGGEPKVIGARGKSPM